MCFQFGFYFLTLFWLVLNWICPILVKLKNFDLDAEALAVQSVFWWLQNGGFRFRAHGEALCKDEACRFSLYCSYANPGRWLSVLSKLLKVTALPSDLFKQKVVVHSFPWANSSVDSRLLRPSPKAILLRSAQGVWTPHEVALSGLVTLPVPKKRAKKKDDSGEDGDDDDSYHPPLENGMPKRLRRQDSAKEVVADSHPGAVLAYATQGDLNMLPTSPAHSQSGGDDEDEDVRVSESGGQNVMGTHGQVVEGGSRSSQTIGPQGPPTSSGATRSPSVKGSYKTLPGTVSGGRSPGHPSGKGRPTPPTQGSSPAPPPPSGGF